MPEIKPTNHLIAYIDFLGTKEKIKNDKDFTYLKFLKELYSILIEHIKKTNKNNEFLNKIKVKIFSDNILLAISTSSSNMQINYAIGELIKIIAIIQLEALNQNILIRGGITIDELYINDNLVYGAGLLKVLTLEEEVAHFPRVIIDNKVCQKYKTYFQANYNTAYDTDNLVYIDFYETCKLKRDIIYGIKLVLLRLLKQYADNPKILSKINWIVNYHNNYVKKYIEQQSDNSLEKLLINSENLINEKNLYSLANQAYRGSL